MDLTLARYRAAHSVLSRRLRPTAIVVVNDLLAVGVMRAASDLGLQISRDVSVAGFDDLPMSNYLAPRLTTVRRDNKAVGQTMTRLLLGYLKDPDRAPQRFEVPTELVIRESTGAAPE